jgi:hypothetical protein
VNARSLAWLNDQPLYFHKCPYVPVPIPVGCYVVPISQWTDGSPKLIQNLSENIKGHNGCTTVRNNTAVPIVVSDKHTGRQSLKIYYCTF